MSESAFDARVRLALHEAYHPFGGFHNNKTGWGESHHDPFGGPGAGDLIGCIMGAWVEVENKTRAGKLRELQKFRRNLITKQWHGLYVVCRELGFNFTTDFDHGIMLVHVAIQNHLRTHLHPNLYTEFLQLRTQRKV
jgi:hypothetical protein